MWIGARFRLPARSEVRAWRDLERDISEAHSLGAVRRYRGKVRRRHELEQEITRLTALPETPTRTRLLARYEDELSALRSRP